MESLDLAQENDFLSNAVQIIQDIACAEYSFIHLNDRMNSEANEPIGKFPESYKNQVSFFTKIMEDPEQFYFWNDESFNDTLNANKGLEKDKRLHYAGLGIRGPSGLVLGFLCVADLKEINLQKSQISILVRLSYQVAMQRELAAKINRILKNQFQLIHSSKMISMNTMAAGLAHEINNPLMVISGKIEILKDKIQSPTVNINMINAECKKICNNVDRISQIVKSLQAFAGLGQFTSMEAMNIMQVVDAAVEMSREKIHTYGVELTFLEEKDLNIECCKDEVVVAINHLINNAIEAVSDCAIKNIKFEVRRSIDVIRLAIFDSGRGLQPDVAARVMDPFFTTKEIGYGMGLGLSIASGIIQAHGGRLYLDPDSEQTCFVVELPLSYLT